MVRCCIDAESSAGVNKIRTLSGSFWNISMYKSLTMCIVFMLVLTLHTSQCAAFETNDIESYLQLLDKNIVEKNESDIVETADTSGIPDQTAAIGRLFKYQIPKNVFPENVTSFKVIELGGDSLPDWLEFDSILNSFLGLPSSAHLGQQHYLQVTPDGAPEGSRDATADMFSITVVEDSVHEADAENDAESGVKAIKCPPGSSVTRATVVVDADMDKLDLRAMVKLMNAMGAHLDMPPELLRMLPVAGRPMVDSAALVSGPGDVRSADTAGTFLEWEVGCGNVQAYHMPILQRVETSSTDGSMAEEVGHGIVGWHVTNNRPPAPHRLKRQARVYPSPRSSQGRRGRGRIRQGAEEEDESSGFWGEPETDPAPTDRPTKSPHIKRTRRPHRTKSHGRHHKTTSVEATTTKAPETSEKMPSTTPVPAPTTAKPIKTPALPPVVVTDEVTDAPTVKTSTAAAPTQPPYRTEETNMEPKVKVELTKLKATVGEIFKFEVPRGTFHDKEDGNTRKLRLMLVTGDRYDLTADSWINFDKSKQTMFGLALPEQAGTYKYELVAMDSNGQIARDQFDIEVSPQKLAGKLSHEFAVTLNEDYDKFVVNMEKRIDVAQKIAKFYGDKDLSKITITRIAPGSVVYAWTNNSLPVSPCPAEEIARLLDFMVIGNDTLNPAFEKAMEPYKVVRAGGQAKGDCKDKTFSTASVPEAAAPDVKESRPETSHDDAFISTVVPGLIIAFMLIVAACIACFLYRKRRKGKLSDEDNRTFVGKGVPVIFANELDDKQDPSTKPLIANDSPPLPPPEYPRGTSPGSGHRQPLLDRDSDDELYNRPPPVNGSARQVAHLPGQSAYRHPPPYTHVPP